MSATRPTDLRVVGGREHVVIEHLQPREATAMLLDALLDAFARAGAGAFLIKNSRWPGATLGVAPGSRRAALDALAALPGPGLHLQQQYPDSVGRQPVAPHSAAAVAAIPEHCPSLLLARFWSVADGALEYGLEHGVQIEFWTRDGGDVVAPAVNAAAARADASFLAPATIRAEGRDRPSIALFDQTFLGEVDFPIDAVYTWVDGDDPAWRERMARARAAEHGVEYHPAAQGAHRYANRDELRYSLRSLDSYAPWIRHVYLVTDAQSPAWLRRDHPRLTVVDHRDIYTDASALPVFNSSAIISQLHHIPDLSEHYLYFNDDVFLGRDVRPETFFLGSGQALVFPAALTRPFGPAHAGEQPQINITKNIRSLLEAELRRSVSTALRHTPYPQLRSVNYELEDRFADVLGATARRRFRHHEDVAQDQLFHYYAQAVGRAVPTSDLGYAYLNIGVAAEALHRMRRVLAARDVDVLCLNDSPEPGEEPVSDRDVVAFLDAYFPLASDFEARPDANARSAAEANR
ncbi:Stealth CR1 domain-containing protein [uncultured Jatrophihabitans sp.]|uniref:stealth family protein n=1 Tax=uncultured Jatrophihabitans sp. TaxID=1610747 RepID=UPI0035CA8AB0